MLGSERRPFLARWGVFCFVGSSLALAACSGADFKSDESGESGGAGEGTGGSSGSTGGTGGGGAKGGSSGSSSGGDSGESSGGTSGSSSGATGGGGNGGGKGGTSGSSSGGSGGGGAEAAMDACADFILASCERQARCGEDVYGGSVDTCATLRDSSCAWYLLPGSGWSASAFDECTEAADTACDAVPTCGSVSGTRKNGLACTSYVQCESGYCATTTSTCGVCGPKPQHPVGGACENNVLDCEPDLDCVEHVCTAPRQEGEACDELHHCAYVGITEGDLDCLEGVCTLRGRPGEPCFKVDAGPSSFCGVGAACSLQNVCVVYELGKAGDECGAFDDRYVDCPDGTCAADPDDATKARCVDWAGPGESCHKVKNFEKCADGLTCENDLCVWPKVAPPPADCN